MSIIRFIYYLLIGTLKALLAPLLILPLLLIYFLLTVGLGLHNQWLRATHNPGYDEFWWMH